MNDKEQLQQEILTASNYIVALEDKCYKANKTSLDLLQTVRELEGEIETLKLYVLDLKGRIAVYIPVRNDPIDAKLAEYINSYPDRKKLKVMFMRDSPGVYEFGQSKVTVKCERDKILVKVGGGHLAIDEFIEQYTALELDRIERKDPSTIQKLAQKVTIQR